VLWGTSVGLVVVVAAVSAQLANDPFGDATNVRPTVIAAPSGASSPRATGTAPADVDPTGNAIPQVVAAAELAREGAPIPSPVIPPLDQLPSDHPTGVPDCWGTRDDAEWLRNCTLNPGGDNGTIVLIGDSHAYQWIPDIEWTAEHDGYRFVPLWHLGCWPTAYTAGGECQDFVRWAEQQVRAIHPDVVLIGGELRFKTPDMIPATAAGLDGLMTALEPSAGHVVLIGDPPSRGDVYPVDCLPAEGATLGTCAWTLEPVQLRMYQSSRQLAEHDGARFLDTIGWFCSDDLCPSIVGHTVTMRENDHISQTYAKELVEVFHDAFQRAVAAQPTG